MKFLDVEKLSQLTSELTDADLFGTNNRVINGRIEAYTMKRAGTDKKVAHALGERYLHEIEEVESEMAKFNQALGKEGDDNNGSSSSRRRRRSQSVDGWTTTSVLSKRGGKGNGSNSIIKSRKRSNSFDISTSRKQGLRLGTNNLRSISCPEGASSDGNHYFSNSPLGNFHEMGTRRLMTDLILTLNASFPDYDFSYVRPSHFTRLPSPSTAMNRTNEKLSEFAATTPSKGRGFLPKLWNAIDDVIVLNECEVYSYVPPTRDEDDDPLGFLSQTLAEDDNAVGLGDAFSSSVGGNDCNDTSSSSGVTLWSFNYFFVNKGLKRIVFFTCVQTMKNESSLIDDDDDSIGIMATGGALDRKGGYWSSPSSSFVVEDLLPSAEGAGSSVNFIAGEVPRSASRLSGYYSLGGSSAGASVTFDMDPDAGAACSVAPPCNPPTVATT